jgi:riboflavin kinase/FMN adenylyltransferase
MRVLYAIGAHGSLGRAVCAVSAFDGVHRGHLALARWAAQLAAREDAAAVAVVLWEGERALAGNAAGAESQDCRLLSLLDERLALLGELDLFDAALVVSRAPDAPALDAGILFSMVEPWLEPVAVLASEELDELLGRLARDLIAAARERGVCAGGPEAAPDEALVVNQVTASCFRPEHDPEQDGERARTTIGSRVVSALLAGDTGTGRGLLGHPYGVAGEVVGGDRRGRVLGYPTANLRLDRRKLLPADGVYAARARLPGESRARHAAVASLGVRPQFGEHGPRLLEVYLLDAALDLYGLTLGVEFVERLREQRRFADVEALKAQMARDVEVARDVLNRE